MVKYALYAHMHAKPGKEAAVEQFLEAALPLLREETKTVGWFAFRMSPGSYGIFDVFEEESDRKAHLSGKIAATLMAKAPELFTQTPDIHLIDVLATKLPGDEKFTSAA